MRHKFAFSLIALIGLLWQQAFGQDYTLSGTISDKQANISLYGASVVVKNSDSTVANLITDENGKFSTTLTAGKYQIIIKYLSYTSVQKKIDLNKDIALNVPMQSDAIQTQTVKVSGKVSEQNVRSTNMGTVKLSINEIKKLPAFMGEVDVLKAIKLLPGVKSNGEGTGGFYVRGGSPDQNLVLLDGATVYNASHLFGFFSVFNSDVIKSAKLIKGGFPANYGGRLSSILDIKQRSGDFENYHGSGGIGIIASRLTLEGPIVKDKLSFLAGARRTYVDLVVLPFVSEDSPLNGNSYYFLDFNANLTYKIGPKDELYISGYYGEDNFKFKSPTSQFEIGIPWANAMATVRYRHNFSNDLIWINAFHFTDYNFQTIADQPDFSFSLYSGIRDYVYESKISYAPNENHALLFGLKYIFHQLTPSSASARFGENTIEPPENQVFFAHNLSLYALDEFNIGPHVRINAGLRVNYFQHAGPYNRFNKDEYGATIDTVFYGTLENIADYWRLEPRVSARFRINTFSSIKAAFTLNYQNLHLANLSTISLPTDIWLPSTSLIKPERAIQANLGYFHNFLNNKIETSVEVYYKRFDGVVEYKDNSSFGSIINDNADNIITFGDGRAFGLEVLVKKAVGKWTGWIGYTLAWTQRFGFDKSKINYDGDFFYPRFDRRHDISIALNYDISKRWRVGAVFVYSSGNTLAVPVSYYFVEDKIVPYFEDRDNYRLPPYHRLDLSVTYTIHKNKKWSSNLNLSVYNVYSRQNPFFIYFDLQTNEQEQSIQFVGKQVSLFPILPAITWNFEF